MSFSQASIPLDFILRCRHRFIWLDGDIPTDIPLLHCDALVVVIQRFASSDIFWHHTMRNDFSVVDSRMHLLS